MKHTPTPYYVVWVNGKYHIQSRLINEDNYVCQCDNKLDADFIIKATNSYEEMRKTLIDLKELIDNGELTVTSRSVDEMMPLHLINMALSQAERK